MVQVIYRQTEKEFCLRILGLSLAVGSIFEYLNFFFMGGLPIGMACVLTEEF